MADYPRFPRITPNMENSSTTFTTSQATSFAPAQTQTISFLDAGGANAFSDNALNQMETWADTLNDKLSADQVKIRNSVQQDQFGSISIRGRLRLNNDLSNPDTQYLRYKHLMSSQYYNLQANSGGNGQTST